MRALNVASATGMPVSLRRPHHFNMSTHGGGELNTFRLLLQLDYWQAVYAENGGDFAAVMDVVFEHTPDDPLARTCGFHFSSQTRRIQPHLGEWLERRLYQFRVTHTFRLIQRRGEPLQNSTGEAGQRHLGHLSRAPSTREHIFPPVLSHRHP